MILKSVRAKNFKRFAELVVEDLPTSGVIGVLGLNESGKSTFGEIISYALFGLTPSAGDGQTKSLLRWGCPYFETQVSFEISGTPYRVYRRFRLEGPSECYLLHETEGREIAVGEKNVTDTIASLLGLGFEEFRHSIYVAQKELALITDPRVRRKDVLEGMLGLNRLREVDREVARQLQGLENERNLESIRLEEIQRLDEEVSRVKAQAQQCLEERDAVMSERQNRQIMVAQTSTQLSEMEEAREARREAEGLDATLAERRAALKTVEENLARAALAQTRFDELGREIETLRDEAEALRQDTRDLKRKLALHEAHEELRERMEFRRGELAQLQSQMNALQGEKRKIEEAEIAVEVRSKDLENHLNMLAQFPTLDTLSAEVRRLSGLYQAVTQKYESFRGRVGRELEKLDELAQKQHQTAETAKLAVRSPLTPAVDGLEIKRLEQAVEAASLAGNSVGLLVGIVAAVVAPVSVLSVVAGPWALLGLAGLGALYLPLKQDQKRIQTLMENRVTLAGLKEQQARHEREQAAYAQALDQWEQARTEAAKAEENLAYLRRLLAFWDDLPIATLAQAKESAASLAEFRDSLTDELLDLLRGFLKEIAPVGIFLPATAPLAPFLEGGFEAAYRQALQGRDEIHREIGELKKSTLGKPALMRQYEQLVTLIAEARMVVDGLEKEVTGFRLPLEQAEDVRQKLAELEEKHTAAETAREAARTEREEQRHLLAAQVPLERDKTSLIQEIGQLTEAAYRKKTTAQAEEDLSETAFDALLKELQRHKDAHAATFIEEARLMGMKEQMEETLRRLKNHQQEEKRIVQRLKLLDRRREEMVTLRECLAITVDRARRRIVPQIRAYFSHILGKLTAGRYHEVELDEDFDLSVFSPERGGLVDISHLSGGTADQMFIALRLALARSTGIGDGGPGRPFLFLDEPLSAFDTDRRALFMALLRTMQPNFQQIFLISHLPDVAPQLDHYLSLSWDGPHLSIHRSWQGETP